MYVEFVGTASLPVQSLESRGAGIRLLNVRPFQESEGDKVIATVYVPKGKRSYFLNKIKAYASEDDKRSGRPKNENLVTNLDDIRVAFLNDLWTDDPILMPGIHPVYIEVWLSTEDEQAVSAFRATMAELGINEHPRSALIKFPERVVLLIHANHDDLERLIDHSDHLAELRSAREASTFFTELDNAEQAEWVDELLGRTEFEDSAGVAICILDSGVNAGHPLLSPIASPTDLHSFDPAWGVADHDGHGTGMAGIAGYGDLHLALASSGRLQVSYRLESAKIIPPRGQNPPELYGHVTAAGIALAEIAAPNRKRVVCLAVTDEGTRDEGNPTSWSAELDQLTSCALDEHRRLVLVSGGNIGDRAEWANYPSSNLTNSIHDPGQSWNALTIGAYTTKVRIHSPDWAGHSPIATAGGLSPFSTTSLTWQPKWPVKPDVVFEGGNAALSSTGRADDVDDLKPLSTARNILVRHFMSFDGTSAATAEGANFAASLWTQYPDLWPETIRALIVHSADWTPAMQTQFLSGGAKGSYRQLLRVCGYGVPNIERATSCLTNRLTIVAQDELRPFARNEKGTIATGDLHFYRLPWPKEALSGLGETPVEMRVTLSYFVEPNPGERGWRERYSYASHGLRFTLNSPNESENEFQERINKELQDEDFDGGDTSAPNEHWQLGQQRDKGSVHSDLWKGTAAELAASNLIAILPVTGWWKLRPHVGRWSKTARYALVVSINTPSESVDIYTPVVNQIAVPIEIDISTQGSDSVS